MDESVKTLYAPEAEEALCGALFMDPGRVEFLDLRPEEFGDEKLRWLYRAIRSLVGQKKAADSVSIIDELKRLGKCDMWQWLEIYGLTTKTPLGTNFETYADIIREKAKRRNIIQQAQKLQQAAMDTAQDTTVQVGKVIDSLTTNAGGKNTAEPIENVALDFHDDLTARLNGEKQAGIMTGFVDFDRTVGGFQPGELVIMSGTPGVGKSMFAMQMALQISRTTPAAIYSLEMGRLSVYRRMVSAASKVEAGKYKAGKITQEEMERYQEAYDRIAERDLYIADGGGWDLLTIKADIMRQKIRHGVRFVVVDYLFLLGDMQKQADEIAGTAYISRGLKQIAMSLNVSLLVIHSLNKDGMGRDGVPNLGSLRGSAQVGYDADIALMMTKYTQEMGHLMMSEKDKENVRGLFFVKGRDLPPMNKFIQFVKNPDFPEFRETVWSSQL